VVGEGVSDRANAHRAAGAGVRISGPGSPSRFGQFHHECGDDENDAERDTRVTTLRVLAEYVSRVAGEEGWQRVRRLGEVQHTSHDGDDSEDDQDYR